MRTALWVLAVVVVLVLGLTPAQAMRRAQAQFSQEPAAPYAGLQSDFDYRMRVDNFTSTGPITAIEFWGYWLDEYGDPVEPPADEYGFNFFFYGADASGKIDTSAMLDQRGGFMWMGSSGGSWTATDTGKLSPQSAPVVKYTVTGWTKGGAPAGPVNVVGDGWLNINGWANGPVFYLVKSPQGDNAHLVAWDFEPAQGDCAFRLLGEATSVETAPQDRGLIGEWDMKLNFGEGQVTSILSVARDTDGKLTADWVSLWGISEVKDIKIEGKHVRLTVSSRFGDQETTSNFIGTLEKGRLSGLLAGDSGEITTEGKRIKRMPRILGSWNMSFIIGERRINTALVISADKENKLQAKWDSEWGEHEISDVQFKADKLTFSRVSKFDDRRWESTYEGTLKGHTLTGAIKSQQGDIPATGKRVGAALAGKWNLTMTSDRGTRTQRLTVHPDLSARFGAFPIDKIKLDAEQVGFDMALEFGEQTFEMSFKGKLDAGKLAGQFTSPQGTSEVTGEKITPTQEKR